MEKLNLFCCRKLEMKKYKAPKGAHEKCGTDFHVIIVSTLIVGESTTCRPQADPLLNLLVSRF